MLKKFLGALAALLLFSVPAWGTTYTSCGSLALPTPNDPAVANTWGTILNTNTSLIDSWEGGTLTLSVAGNTNVVLTSNNGAADQARNKYFDFTGALTGNIYVLWPAGRCESMIVRNRTSGAFTLSIGANDGSGSPAGTTYTVSQGETVTLFTTGTNVVVANSLVQSSGPCTTSPTIGGSTGNPTVSYTSQVCRYVKTGLTETVTANIAISAISGGSGAALLKNVLQDAPNTTSGLNGSCSAAFIIGLNRYQSSDTQWGVSFSSSTNDLIIYEMGATTSSSSYTFVPIDKMQSNFAIQLTCTYETQS